MFNYIKADLYRSARNKTRYIAMIITYVVAILGAYVITPQVAKHNVDSGLFFSSFKVVMFIITLVVTLVEIEVILALDFKAKTMQTAIGRGISRRDIVLSKFIEFELVVFVELMLFAIISIVFGITRFSINQTDIIHVFSKTLSEWIESAAMFGISSVFLFKFENIISYVLFQTGVVSTAISLITIIPLFKKIDISKYMISGLVSSFSDSIINGKFEIISLIGILAYIIVGLIIGIKVFEKKELEF